MDEPPVESTEDEVPTRRGKHSRPPAPLFELGAPPSDEAPDDVGTELALEAEDESASSTERLIAREDEAPGPESELPLGERETVPTVARKLVVAEADVLRDEQESFPPVVEERDEPAEEAAPSEEQLRRRARLRRFVAGAVVTAAVLTVGLVAAASLSPDVEYAQRQGVASAARAGQQAVADARARAREARRVEAPPVAQPENDLGDDYDAIGKETVRLLNAREFEKAAGHARRLIELKPASAFGYRCLGSALQDLGRIDEARAAYSDCVTHATKGEVFECSALGGVRKKP